MQSVCYLVFAGVFALMSGISGFYTNKKNEDETVMPPGWLSRLGIDQGTYRWILHVARGLSAAIMFVGLSLFTGFGSVCTPFGPLPTGLPLGINVVLTGLFASMAEYLPGFVASPAAGGAGYMQLHGDQHDAHQ